MKPLSAFPLVLSLLLAAHAAYPADTEEPGPAIVTMAQAENPKPDSLPTIRVLKEKLWGKYFPIVSVTFPNLPDFTCDSWCYESEVEFLDARPAGAGAIEMRHRDKLHPGVLVLTTITPNPGGVLLDARVALDPAVAGAALPPAPPNLNLCWQLRHAPAFASQPDKYPAFVKRCFLFTPRGRVFLLDTDRKKIPVQAPDHEYNNPPWVQMYVRAGLPIPETPPTAWAGYSADSYVTPIIGAVSRDGKYLAAIANDSADSMAQAWHDCMHNNPKWLPEGTPVQERHWRVGLYAMENNPEALIARVAQDFPKAKVELPPARP